MKKRLYGLLALALIFACVPLKADGAYPCRSGCRSSCRGDAAGYSCRDATVLSMMGWGVGLAVGIGLLCGMLSQDTAHDHCHCH